MSKKTLAVSTQLKNALQQIEKLEKELKDTKASADRHYQADKEKANQLEQLHQFLDAVPNSIARKSEGENSWERIERNPVTRLAAWLAVR